jgi:hypothetical protein
MLAVLADSFVSTRPVRPGRLIRLGGAQPASRRELRPALRLIKSLSLMIR